MDVFGLHAVVVAAAAADRYRATFLAQTAKLVFVNSGDALRVATDCDCERVAAGTPIVLTLDANGVVRALHRASGADDGLNGTLPRASLITDPRSAKADRSTVAETHSVVVTIVAAVPADTPQGDNLYISTDRSSWNAAELRMDRVDALHWSVTLRLAEGSTLLYRFSRGSFATLERDRSGILGPPRSLVARDGLKQQDTVQHFADLL